MASFVRWNETTQIWEKAVDPNSPSTAWNHLPIGTPTQPGDTVNKAYVDGLIGGGGFVPYNGAIQNVNLGGNAINAGAGTISGPFNITGVTTLSGEVNVTGGSGTSYATAPIEIIFAGPPRIGFHWPGVVASQLGMDSSGNIRTYDNPGTGYANFIAATITSNGNVMVGGNLHATAGYVYPGNVAAGGGYQGNWYLASHGAYGLYTNTGLYINENIYVAQLGGWLGTASVQNGFSFTLTSIFTAEYGYVRMVFTKGVATSYTPALFSLTNLPNAPVSPGDVYNNGDGILRIGM